MKRRSRDRSEPFHLGLLIPDGPGVRNLELTRFPQICREAGLRVTAFTVSAPPIASGDQARAEGPPGSLEPPPWRSLPMPDERPPRSASFWRFASYYAHLRWADTVSMRKIYAEPVQGPLVYRTLRRLTKAVGASCATPRGIARLDHLHHRGVARSRDFDDWSRRLAADPPDYLLASHQRPPSTVAPVLAAQSLGVPTGSLIFSWDNLTSKGRVAAPFESYMVWSELMRSELLRFYPELSPERVRIVGAPQFDPYADDALLRPREEFLRSLGLDPARPVICYSGGDTKTCPEDPQHLELLLQSVREGRIGQRDQKPQVVVRPSPVDDRTRYESVLSRFPEARWSQPHWHSHSATWLRILPTAEDVELLANLTQHCDLNINTASTMSLDFAIRDRPVVNLAMDMSDPPVYGGRLRDAYYKFDHYQRVIESGAVRVAYTADELCSYVDSYLADPTLDREGRRRLVDLQVGRPIGTACAAIAEASQELAIVLS